MSLYDAAPAFAAALPAAGRLVGFDVGTKTIGVAVSDPDRLVASPLFTQRRSQWTKDAAAIADALADRAPVGFVIGLPLHMTGEMSPRAQAARQFA
ncbi:MAG: Holliday junction resolvase RuvX, partial [Pseudomonadota bacterium]